MTSVLQGKPPSDDVYTYTSYPRVIHQKKTKKKYSDYDNDYLPMYQNVSFDRRVIRGLTFSQPPLCESSYLSQQKKGSALKQRKPTNERKKFIRSFTPPSIHALEFVPIHTELYLEECSEPVEVFNCDTQTDTFIGRPPTPPYVPAKTGLDACTQIYEGELFDFDIEVVPLLQILTEKIIEQSLIEVREEEEIAYLREEQNKFVEKRNAELAEQRRLEERERKLQQEKDVCLRKLLKALEIQKETMVKVTTLAFTQGYLSDLLPVIYQNLVDTHYFYDSTEINIDHEFMPWLADETLNHLNKVILYRTIIDGLICENINQDDSDYFPLLALQMNVYRHHVESDTNLSECLLGFTAQEIEEHEKKLEELRQKREERILLREAELRREAETLFDSEGRWRGIQDEEIVEDEEEEEERRYSDTFLYGDSETTGDN